MADLRTLSEHYAEIGTRVRAAEPSLAALRASEATVCYLVSPVAKASRGRRVCAQCERVPDRWKWAVPCDFTVTVFEPNVRGMTDDQLYVLIFHELLHAEVDHDKDGCEVYRTRPHDVEDFREVIERWGLDWAAVPEA